MEVGNHGFIKRNTDVLFTVLYIALEADVS